MATYPVYGDPRAYQPSTQARDDRIFDVRQTPLPPASRAPYGDGRMWSVVPQPAPSVQEQVLRVQVADLRTQLNNTQRNALAWQNYAHSQQQQLQAVEKERDANAEVVELVRRGAEAVGNCLVQEMQTNKAKEDENAALRAENAQLRENDTKMRTIVNSVRKQLMLLGMFEDNGQVHLTREYEIDDPDPDDPRWFLGRGH